MVMDLKLAQAGLPVLLEASASYEAWAARARHAVPLLRKVRFVGLEQTRKGRSEQRPYWRRVSVDVNSHE